MIKSLFDEIIAFVRKVYFVDACAVAAMYPDWFNYGAGVTNYLAVPDLPLDSAMTQFDLPGGIIFDGKLDAVEPALAAILVELYRLQAIPRLRSKPTTPSLWWHDRLPSELDRGV